MIGDEASKLRSLLEISYPMENGTFNTFKVSLDILIIFVSLFFEKVLFVIGPTCVMFGIILFMIK